LHGALAVSTAARFGPTGAWSDPPRRQARPPPPLAGEGGGGGRRCAEASGGCPPPSPPPQAGGGAGRRTGASRPFIPASGSAPTAARFGPTGAWSGSHRRQVQLPPPLAGE